MNKLLKSVASVVAAAILLTTTVSANSPEKLVILGDSITSGYGLEGYASGDNTSADGSFSNRLADTYGLSDGDNYINFAVDGLTTDGLHAKLAEPDTAQAVKNADTVVVSIGGNDLLMVFFTVIQQAAVANADMFTQMGITADLTTIQGVFTALSQALALDTEGTFLKTLASSFTSPETAAQFTTAATKAIENAAVIMTTLFTLNPELDVYLLTIYNPFENVEGFESISAIAELVLNALKNGYIKTAEQMTHNGFNMTVVDVNTLFKGKALALTNIASLDIHPNADGHTEIYNALCSAFDANQTAAPDEIVANEEPTAEDSDIQTTEELTAEDSEIPTTEEPVDTGNAPETDVPESSAPATEKGSPDTGISDIAAVAGLGVLAAGLLIISKRKNK